MRLNLHRHSPARRPLEVYSDLSVWKNEGAEVTAEDRRIQSTSKVFDFKDIERSIGENVKNQTTQHSEHTMFDAKRIVDRKFADPIVQSDMKLWSFRVLSGAGEKPMIQVQIM